MIIIYCAARIISFSNNKIDIENGDTIYLFTDGFPDQFGGSKGKKFMYKKFRRLIAETSNIPIKEQGEQMEAVLDEWQNHTNPYSGKAYEQIDDITVVGIKISPMRQA